MDLPADMPGADARRGVSGQRCNPCANPHDRGDMPKYLPAELTQYMLNNSSNKSPPYRVAQDDVSTLFKDSKWRNHRTPIGSRSRWGHGGDVRDALDGSFQTVLGTGNGPPILLPGDNIALLGRHSESAPPNQPYVPPDAISG